MCGCVSVVLTFETVYSFRPCSVARRARGEPPLPPRKKKMPAAHAGSVIRQYSCTAGL